MPTQAQLQADLTAAMKARDMNKVYVLRDVLAAIKNLKVEKQVPELPEADLIAVVRKEISKRREAADFARQGNRPDLIEKNDRECVILEAYVPQQLDAAALEGIISSIAAELGTTQIGPIMARLREGHAGRFDGKLASELIRKLAQ